MREHGEDIPFSMRPDECLLDGEVFRDLRLLPANTARSLAENVISRLALKESWARLRDPAPDPARIEAFCDSLIGDDPEAGFAFVDEARAAGASADTLYLGYVASAARRLGERWETDRASFMDVTIGLARLHQIVLHLGPTFFTSQPTEPNGHTAMLAAVPGEDHVLGVMMATDYFRRQGWRIDVELAPTLERLGAQARTHDYDMIGLSASTRGRIDALAGAIAALRRLAPGALYVVGGHITEIEPDVAARVGADFAAGDASAASIELQRAVRQHRERT